MLTLDSWVRQNPGFVGEIRARVRAEEPLDEILAGVFEAIHGDAFLGMDAVGDFLRIQCRDDWRRPESLRTSAAGPAPAGTDGAPAGDRAGYPPPDALAAALSARGAAVLEEHLDPTTLTIRIRQGDSLVDLQIFDAGDPRQHYRIAGDHKVAYSGPLTDMTVMEALVRCLETHPSHR